MKTKAFTWLCANVVVSRTMDRIPRSIRNGKSSGRRFLIEFIVGVVYSPCHWTKQNTEETEETDKGNLSYTNISAK
jgi:hypothetical protein